MNSGQADLDTLWTSAPPAERDFEPRELSHLPEIVQRYLAHSIAPGTPLASAVRMRMHGTIKLKKWRRFKAEQVIVRDRGMIWQARMRGRSLRGARLRFRFCQLRRLDWQPEAPVRTCGHSVNRP